MRLNNLLIRMAIPAALALGGAAFAQTVPLELVFKLTDSDYKPLAGVPVRLTFGSDRDWQSPTAGQRVITDTQGEARLTAQVALDKRQRKKPANFADSLGSRTQETDHLLVAAELEYMNHRWLYAVDLLRFPDGDILQDGFSIYTRDEKGLFTRKAARNQDGWKIADLGGLILTKAGYEPASFMLAPNAARTGWTLRLGYIKFPEPVRR